VVTNLTCSGLERSTATDAVPLSQQGTVLQAKEQELKFSYLGKQIRLMKT
jgi:hypothetical protein